MLRLEACVTVPGLSLYIFKTTTLLRAFVFLGAGVVYADVEVVM